MNVIDLTQTIHYNMHIFESDPKPLTIPWAKMDTHGYESELITTINLINSEKGFKNSF